MIDLSPIWISLKTGIFTIMIVFILGIIAARWVLNLKNNTLKIMIDGLLTLPLVLPPTVLGFFLLYIFGVHGLVGSFLLEVFHIRITFSWIATVIAAVTVAFPLMYRSTKGAFELIDQDIIDAARTLGMSEMTIFIKIMIPSALPGIISGSILAFARGLGEFGATSMLAGNISGKTRTLPLAVYSEVAGGNMSQAGFYVMIIVVICFVAVVIMNYYSLKEEKKKKEM
ncbi:MAG: molybdate ABC transporter permease subunit [Faecalibacillus sp.]